MAALTRRERKVKDILLKELRKMSDTKMLTYAQKQHLEKTLDVEHIDTELAKMRKKLQWVQPVMWLLVPLCAFAFLGGVYGLATGDPFESFSLQLFAPFYPLGFFWQVRSIKRKSFIYEALRELSDADEAGVQLDRAVREADELIERVVRRELGEEALPKEKATGPRRQRVPRAPFAPHKRATPAAGSKGVSLAEMQRRKEAGSTILDY